MSAMLFAVEGHANEVQGLVGPDLAVCGVSMTYLERNQPEIQDVGNYARIVFVASDILEAPYATPQELGLVGLVNFHSDVGSDEQRERRPNISRRDRGDFRFRPGVI